MVDARIDTADRILLRHIREAIEVTDHFLAERRSGIERGRAKEVLQHHLGGSGENGMA